MAHVLSKQGLKCTVLFSLHARGACVDPENHMSLTNPAVLEAADAIVMALRFRNWPDAAFAKFEAALQRGVPADSA